MIDASTYSQLHSNGGTSANGLRPKDNLGDDAMVSDRPPDGNFIFLLPPTIYGYDMRKDQWRNLLVANTSCVIWNKSAFDHLILAPSKKDLLAAMVTSKESNDNTGDEDHNFNALFHGSLGTGKTFAAEAIAEYVERPIYCIRPSNIDTSATDAEQYLRSILYIITKWRCVLLLDDSDIFLEQRLVSMDMKRNFLISVFLRFVEQYNGIIILNTNRMDKLDEAFKARIQLTLYFPALDTTARSKIWQNIISALQEPGENANVNELLDGIPEFAKCSLDGRGIKNAVDMAQKLARFERKALDFSHFERVMNASGEFKTP